VLPTRDLQAEVLEGLAVTTHYGDARKGEQWRWGGVHSGFNGIDRLAISRTVDNVILTERRCEARDQGRRMSEEAILSCLDKDREGNWHVSF
jgi:hypothetical protein